MNKFFALLTFAIAFNAYALVCTVSTTFASSPDWSETEITSVKTVFGQLTKASTSIGNVEFTAQSEMTNPDSSVEFIEIANSSQCEQKAFFNNNRYDGIIANCFSEKSVTGYDLVTVACRF